MCRYAPKILEFPVPVGNVFNEKTLFIVAKKIILIVTLFQVSTF